MNATNQGPPLSIVPSVSVIVPARDYARYLGDAVESLQAQTLSDWECIVVDDGSTDSTPSLLAQMAKADRRIIPFRQIASGVSAARNAGLAMARGTYVQFLDADDRLHRAKFADHVAAFEAHPNVGIVYGPSHYAFETEGRAVRPLEDPSMTLGNRALEWSGAEMLRLLLVHNQFPVEAPLVRREVFATGLVFDEHLARMEDWDLWVRLAMAGIQFAFIPSTASMATIRVHEASVSQAEQEMFAAEIAIRERLRPLLFGDAPVQRLNLVGLANRRIELAVARAMSGDVLAGFRALLPLFGRSWRPGWVMWALLMPMGSVEVGRRLLARVWIRRRLRSRSK